MTYIKARPTTYNGIEMRSRLEAAFAQWLDNHNETWQYEPKAFASAEGQYLPDFTVQRGYRLRVVEVKPTIADFDEALEKMHVVLASEPDAELYVFTSHDYEDFGWIRRCTSHDSCGQCSRARKGDEELSHCRQCGSEWTHLVEVAPYDSRPPEQRLSVVLTFSCEYCQFLTHLTFEQHKGQTLKSFRTSLDDREEEQESERSTEW